MQSQLLSCAKMLWSGSAGAAVHLQRDISDTPAQEAAARSTAEVTSVLKSAARHGIKTQ
jgi:hypothetical protein